MELEHLRSTPALDPIHLYIEVVGGAYTSIVVIEEHVFGVDMHVQDLRVPGPDEFGIPMESSLYIDSSHTDDSVV